jgi:cytochrome c biogenesis protein CcmG, thiol:disulfide interchange protein DsbE
MPALAIGYTVFRGKIGFVGIDVEDPRAEAASFARRLGITYPLLSDDDGTIAAAFRLDALPLTFILSPRGTIIARHAGALTAPKLATVLDMD